MNYMRNYMKDVRAVKQKVVDQYNDAQLRQHEKTKESYIKTYYKHYSVDQRKHSLPQINEHYLDSDFMVSDFNSFKNMSTKESSHRIDGLIARSRFASDNNTKLQVKNAVNMQYGEALLDNFSGIGSKLTSV